MPPEELKTLLLEAKKKRRNCKAAITRLGKVLDRLINEKWGIEEIQEILLKIDTAFDNLVETHTAYTQMIDEEDEFETAEIWLDDVQNQRNSDVNNIVDPDNHSIDDNPSTSAVVNPSTSAVNPSTSADDNPNPSTSVDPRDSAAANLRNSIAVNLRNSTAVNPRNFTAVNPNNFDADILSTENMNGLTASIA
ncbi:hypothetical protein LOTGIDRAFT_160859 [Lottia gigantea]|uniref:Uncharacterized protein n=1 Tax=Lottia gigantea TaxID=225164 RepID=V3ZUD7_LOTGI|nr:hypothetical protein LOTGIDRAFT_160859 [Lottia gigantea]ESO95098.1 hypothetical protein LOTGIDRAFT_160859 [Lottia gigantea]